MYDVPRGRVALYIAIWRRTLSDLPFFNVMCGLVASLHHTWFILQQYHAPILNLSLAPVSRTTIFSGISNPFVVKAIASSCMATARKERPADRNSLDRLQRDADNFILEVGWRFFVGIGGIKGGRGGVGRWGAGAPSRGGRGDSFISCLCHLNVAGGAHCLARR